MVLLFSDSNIPDWDFKRVGLRRLLPNKFSSCFCGDFRRLSVFDEFDELLFFLLARAYKESCKTKLEVNQDRIDGQEFKNVGH